MITKQRYIENTHILKHLIYFNPPSFLEVLKLKDFLVSESSKNKHLWFKYDEFQSLLAFTICTED